MCATRINRDQYGFLKSSQWITEGEFNGFEDYYAPIMKRRLLKWRQLMDENSGQFPGRSSKGIVYNRRKDTREEVCFFDIYKKNYHS
jgi:hypothetical protein